MLMPQLVQIILIHRPPTKKVPPPFQGGGQEGVKNEKPKPNQTMNDENKVPEQEVKKATGKTTKILLTIAIAIGGVGVYFYFSSSPDAPPTEQVTTDTTIVVNEVSPDSAVHIIVTDTTKNDSAK